VQSAWLFSGRKTGVTGAGQQKENAEKTVPFLHVRWSGAGTITTALSSRVKDSGSLTSGTEKNMG